MSWKSGSRLMGEIIEALKPSVTDEIRRDVYVTLIRAFEDRDCDTLQDCLDADPVFAEAFGLVHPHAGGFRAAFDGKLQEENPFEMGTYDAGEWYSGWMEYHRMNIPSM